MTVMVGLDKPTMYLAAYDKDGTYMGDVNGDWTSEESQPVFNYTGTGAMASYTLDPNASGKGYMVATFENGPSDTTGLITVMGDGPAMLNGYAADRNGDGYVDSFVVYYDKTFNQAGEVTSNTGFSLAGINAINIEKIVKDTAESTVTIYGTNQGPNANTTPDERHFQDSGDPYSLGYDGISDAIQDIYGIKGEKGTILLADQAGPVIAKAIYDDNKTVGEVSDDVLIIYLSEKVDHTSYPVNADSVLEILGLGSFGNNSAIDTSLSTDDIIVVRMGSDGEALVPGEDYVKLDSGIVADNAGNTAAANNQPILVHLPAADELLSEVTNYPNPFKADYNGVFGPSRPVSYDAVKNLWQLQPKKDCTLIKYRLNKKAKVEIAIFSVLGIPVIREAMEAGGLGGSEGYNYFYWNGTNGRGRLVGAGAYILVMKAMADDGTKDKVRRKIGVLRK
jgi:hypothetical protein